MVQALITILFIAVIMAIMAVGVIFGRRALRGSCGGISIGEDGEPIACANCGCRAIDKPGDREAA